MFHEDCNDTPTTVILLVGFLYTYTTISREQRYIFCFFDLTIPLKMLCHLDCFLELITKSYQSRFGVTCTLQFYKYSFNLCFSCSGSQQNCY